MEQKSKDRAALVVIDLQNGFFEDPVLSRDRTRIVESTNTLAEQARAAGAPVFTIVTEHAQDRCTWTLNMRDDGQGFNFAGTAQASLLPGLHLPGAHRVAKLRDSAFLGTDLAQRLRLAGVEKVLLAGVSAQSCVAQTGADAFAHDFRVAYATDAIGSPKPELGSRILDFICDEYRQECLAGAAAEAWLSGRN
ncbi:isochorismatase [Zafaria cholistanensis]|uniref:Isochorismatase n=1 Tax=Zafaria cholistanensis TaxID=1682741 RepID=A0A5A7NQG3_9MICC|nr:isochorismatase family cysteine hydrolase [Zafaria cholistanensis]GER23103.1 isochorismatase [Zafaria cholistanensis]